MSAKELCLEENAIEDYVLGQLDERQTASAEEHLLICRPCQDALAAAKKLVQAMKKQVGREERVARLGQRKIR